MLGKLAKAHAPFRHRMEQIGGAKERSAPTYDYAEHLQNNIQEDIRIMEASEMTRANRAQTNKQYEGGMRINNVQQQTPKESGTSPKPQKVCWAFECVPFCAQKWYFWRWYFLEPLGFAKCAEVADYRRGIVAVSFVERFEIFAVLIADNILTEHQPSVTSDLVTAYHKTGMSRLSVTGVDWADFQITQY